MSLISIVVVGFGVSPQPLNGIGDPYSFCIGIEGKTSEDIPALWDVDKK